MLRLYIKCVFSLHFCLSYWIEFNWTPQTIHSQEVNNVWLNSINQLCTFFSILGNIWKKENHQIMRLGFVFIFDFFQCCSSIWINHKDLHGTLIKLTEALFGDCTLKQKYLHDGVLRHTSMPIISCWNRNSH